MISDLIDQYWFYLDGHHNGDDGGFGVDYDEHGNYGRR